MESQHGDFRICFLSWHGSHQYSILCYAQIIFRFMIIQNFVFTFLPQPLWDCDGKCYNEIWLLCLLRTILELFLLVHSFSSKSIFFDKLRWIFLAFVFNCTALPGCFSLFEFTWNLKWERWRQIVSRNYVLCSFSVSWPHAASAVAVPVLGTDPECALPCLSSTSQL